MRRGSQGLLRVKESLARKLCGEPTKQTKARKLEASSKRANASTSLQSTDHLAKVWQHEVALQPTVTIRYAAHNDAPECVWFGAWSRPNAAASQFPIPEIDTLE